MQIREINEIVFRDEAFNDLEIEKLSEAETTVSQVSKEIFENISCEGSATVRGKVNSDGTKSIEGEISFKW